MAKRDPGKEGDEAKRLWKISAMGSELAFGIIGMVLLGLLLDWWLGWSPWGVITCTVLGVVGTGYNFIRQALALNRGAGTTARPTGPKDDSAREAPAKDTKADDLEFPPDFDTY